MGDETAVVGVEPHHIGDGTQRDEIEQAVEPRLVGQTEPTPAAQFGAQRHQHIERHAHAGQILALEAAAGLIRIHDHRVRQHDLIVQQGRQMMVGHQHLQAQRPRMRDAVQTRNAVVHGHQHLGPLRYGQIDYCRGQAVTMHGAVWHHIAQRPGLGAEQPQAAQSHGAGGGAIAVVIGDDADGFTCVNRIGQQPGRLRRAFQSVG